MQNENLERVQKKEADAAAAVAEIEMKLVGMPRKIRRMFKRDVETLRRRLEEAQRDLQEYKIANGLI